MNTQQSQNAPGKVFTSMKRKGVNAAQDNLVKIEQLSSDQPLPVVLQPVLDHVHLVEWMASKQDLINTLLTQHGALLFRNFHRMTITQFEQFVTSVGGDLLEYTYRSTPRSQVSGKIYTSTEYSADQVIPLHNEMSYTNSWPMKIGFFCVQAATQGGETPIADSRNVFRRISPEIRERFIEKKVMYVRNYGERLDLPWQTVFQTQDKAEVEHYCRAASIDFEWKSDKHLRTRQICQAVATHPHTGEAVWFNQAHLFHVSSLQQPVRASLLALFKTEDLPRNAYYGDGTPIEDDVLDHIRAAYQQETISFPWRVGDILLLDNMLMAHGRSTYTGPRKVVVGMAQQYSNEQ